MVYSNLLTKTGKLEELAGFGQAFWLCKSLYLPSQITFLWHWRDRYIL